MIRKNIWASFVKCYSSMGQSGFMVKKRNLPQLLSFSALLVCILPHCRLRDLCGNMRKASGHVVCRLDIPHFGFHILLSAILPTGRSGRLKQHQTKPHWGAYSAPPGALAGREGSSCSSPRNPPLPRPSVIRASALPQS